MTDRERGAPRILALDENGVRVFAGMGYGLGRPIMAVRMRFRVPAGLDPEHLVTRLESLVGEALEEVEPDPAPAGKLLNIALRLHQLIQWQQSIPAFGGWRISWGQKSGSEEGSCQIALCYESPESSMIALRWATRTVNALLEKPGGREESDALREELAAVRSALKPWTVPSNNMMQFLKSSEQMGVQVIQVAGYIYNFGQGRRSRSLESSITDQTSGLAIGIARRKIQTAQVLGQLGIPVPRHGIATDADAAVAMAEKLGFPVVIKPNDQDQGRGVFAGLRSGSRVRTAFAAAREYSQHVLVESFCPGDDYRFTVVHGQVLKIMHRKPGGVTGDGRHTVVELLAEVQDSPEHQRTLRRSGKLRLQLDDEALELLQEQGLEASSVPEQGRFVALRRKSNISSGGSYVIVPAEQVHPDNIALVIRAARGVGLDLAGVDLITPDISRPWHENGAVVIEVNAQPQIGIRDTPDAFKDILRMLLNGDGSIDCHLLVAPQSALPDERVHRLADTLGCHAISSMSGCWLDGRQCLWGQRNSFIAARAMLLDRTVESVLMVMRPEDIIRFGLPVPRVKTAHVMAMDGPEGREPLRTRQQQAANLIAFNTDKLVKFAEPGMEPEAEQGSG